MSEINEITCPCGAVVVRVRGEPELQFYCHCDDCQIVSGGAYVPVALFGADAVLSIEGRTETWTYKVLPRQRCAVCGCGMLAEVPGIGQFGISGNRLPAGMLKPEFHIQCRYAQRPVVDDLPHYASLPEMFGGEGQLVDW